MTTKKTKPAVVSESDDSSSDSEAVTAVENESETVLSEQTPDQPDSAETDVAEAQANTGTTADEETVADEAAKSVAKVKAAKKVKRARKAGLAHKLYVGDISYDFVGHRRRWYAISATLLLISILALSLRGLNLGIEFKGGVVFQAPTAISATTVADVRSAVESLGIGGNDEISVTTIGDNQVQVETSPLETDQIAQVQQAIATKLGISQSEVTTSMTGASWGQEVTNQSLIALAVFLTLVMLLIWAYFRQFKMSISAIVALVHDLVITIGIYALIGFSVTPATVVGLLTILGYSLYDTVVVFDKVRENTHDLTNSKLTYSQAANAAVNQTLVRSLNTTIIGVLPVAALLFTGWFILGTGPLKDLGLALFVGMITGAYSSVFIATPLLAQLRERDADMVAHRQRIERRESREELRTVTKSKTLAMALDSAAPSEQVAAPGLVPADKVQSGNRRQPTKQTRAKRKN
jgi:preprotein translocase subunit SecF